MFPVKVIIVFPAVLCSVTPFTCRLDGCDVFFSSYAHVDGFAILRFIVRTLREDQPLRLLLNLLFYHFNRSEPTYKSQRIKLLDVIAACNQLNVNALN